MATLHDEDVIVATASPAGRGAISLVRLSGGGVHSLVGRLCPGGPQWVPRRASLRHARAADRSVIDDVLVVWMPGPHSYTGEDVVELSCHGNPAIVDAVVARCVALGARPAGPGEFTRRALLAGRMDLLQAESIDSLIRAQSVSGVQAARAGLDGRLSSIFDASRQRILDFGAELEARLEHPGEDLGEMSDQRLISELADLAGELKALAATWSGSKRRIEGATVALVGEVNAGKSSLFNQLVGSQRAIVSAEPGTTRDAVERTVDWNGLRVTFLDTAGRRAATGSIEAAGIALGRDLADRADLRLRVFNPHTSVASVELPEPTWTVATHRDVGALPRHSKVDHYVSSTSGEGLNALRSALSDWLGVADPAGRAVVGSQRQHDLLIRIAAHVEAAAEAMQVGAGPVVAAEELVIALERLGSLTGQSVREDVLDRLFSRFCVGK